MRRIVCEEHLNASPEFSGGRGRDRTGDPLLAKQVLSQLSYTPIGNWLSRNSKYNATNGLFLLQVSLIVPSEPMRVLIHNLFLDRVGKMRNQQSCPQTQMSN
jgi:hypothetical protein